MVVLVAYSPTLYQIFCRVTGYGGTVRSASADQVVSSESDELVTVAFDANVSADLPWEFRPEQKKTSVRFGEPAKIYYYAKNTSDKTTVGRAAFNVTPYTTAPFFFKIECFCFIEEKLGPGESARMPLVFYVDEEMLKDVSAKTFRNITLSYTFYPAKNLTPDQAAAARDLRKESKKKDDALVEGDQVRFDNDAPRR